MSADALHALGWFIVGCAVGASIVYVVLTVLHEPWDDDDWPRG